MHPPIPLITEADLMAQARAALQRRSAEIASVKMPADKPEPVCILKPAVPERHARSLRACHRPMSAERRRHNPPSDTGAFIPATSARLDADMNLTDGARRCARKIMEETYRRNRQGRALEITVSYLAKSPWPMPEEHTAVYYDARKGRLYPRRCHGRV